MEEWEKEYNNMYYLIQLDSLSLYHRLCEQQEEYETASFVDNLQGIVEDNFIKFRLKEYDSDYRCLIRKIYTDILGYNPYNPKQMK